MLPPPYTSRSPRRAISAPNPSAACAYAASLPACEPQKTQTERIRQTLSSGTQGAERVAERTDRSRSEAMSAAFSLGTRKTLAPARLAAINFCSVPSMGPTEPSGAIVPVPAIEVPAPRCSPWSAA